MTVRNHGVYSHTLYKLRYLIQFRRFKNTDEFVCCRYRLFAEQVPQGSLLCSLQRAPCSHVRSPLRRAEEEVQRTFDPPQEILILNLGVAELGSMEYT